MGGSDGVSVVATIRRDEGGYTLTLRTAYDGASEDRMVDDSSCDALADSTALIIAASLSDAEFDTERPPPLVPRPIAGSSPEALSAEAPAAEPVRADPRPASTVSRSGSPASARRRPARPKLAGWSLLPGPLAEYGALPGLAGGVRIAAGPQWRRASVEGFAQWVAPRETPTILGARGVAQLAAGGLRGCLRNPVGQAHIPVCVLLEAGVLSVRSQGIEPARTLRYAWVAPGARAGVERHWGRWGVFAAAELAIPLDRPRALIGSATAFQSLSVSVRGVVGLSIFFATDLD